MSSQGDGDHKEDRSSQPTESVAAAAANNNADAAVAEIVSLLRSQANLQARPVTADAVATSDTSHHAFWDTQPMLHAAARGSVPTATNSAVLSFPAAAAAAAAADNNSNNVCMHGPIVPDKAPSDLRAEPYNMPKGFTWSDVDLTQPQQLDELYHLLANNYVEDTDAVFRFDYSPDFLLWALTPPGYQAQYHVGVRSAATGKLVAFISGVPAHIRVYHITRPMVEINFLCVHKKLRSKRLAPVLIKEITRRVNHMGVFQAVYTAGVVLPVPVSSCRYWHRSLNVKKLIEIGFSRLPPRMTMARYSKLLKIPDNTTIPGLGPMEDKHVVSAHALLQRHLEQFQLVVDFSLDDFRHWLLPRKGVISSFVKTSIGPDGQEIVTDLISFYHLPSSLTGVSKYTHVRAAYSFYNVATSVDIVTLMRDALVLAKQGQGDEEADVFNALGQMKNDDFIQELKFGKGDGNLQFYLYNWACPPIESKDVGIVLL